MAGRDGGGGAALALEREHVLVFAADVAARGDVLGGDAHDAVAEGVGENPGQHVDHVHVAQLLSEARLLQEMRRPAHDL